MPALLKEGQFHSVGWSGIPMKAVRVGPRAFANTVDLSAGVVPRDQDFTNASQSFAMAHAMDVMSGPRGHGAGQPVNRYALYWQAKHLAMQPQEVLQVSITPTPEQIEELKAAMLHMRPGPIIVERAPLPEEIAGALDRMDSLLLPDRNLLACGYDSATVKGSRADMALIRQALASQPVPTSFTGGDWMAPTTVAQRLGDAMQLLCGGKRPPEAMVAAWLDHSSEDLQWFASTHGPAWTQGIGLIDAAMAMVDQPTEGVDHEHREVEPAAMAATPESKSRVLYADEPIDDQSFTPLTAPQAPVAAQPAEPSPAKAVDSTALYREFLNRNGYRHVKMRAIAFEYGFRAGRAALAARGCA